MPKNTNQCPDCGGTADHIITDINGKCYYQCGTGLTSFPSEHDKVSRIVRCDLILDEGGNKATGTIAYATGNRTKILAVTDGRERGRQ